MEDQKETFVLKRRPLPDLAPTIVPGPPSLSILGGKTVPVPSIGRSVHYYAYGTPGGEYEPGAVRAATVVGVLGEPGDPYPSLNLFVMTPQGSFHNTAAYGPGKAGCWGWPAYVPPVALPE